MLIFSALIIFNYYQNKAHIENFDWYLPYFISVLTIYWIYKFFQLNSLEKKVTFSPIKIFGFFFVHLILLCILFFSYNDFWFWDSLWNWIWLSLKILLYSLLPIIITLISTAFWQKSLSLFLEKYKEKSSNYKFITWIWIWIFSFIFLLTILWMLWAYNLISVFLILIFFAVISYKELFNLISWIWSYKIKCTNHNIYSKNTLEKINPKLLSTEFLFIIITLLLSVNLISIFRPFPIGWDDLWAYMNFARLMADDGSIWFLGSMMSWQTFTWIGYMFNNPTLAFFLNNLWWFISVIVIVLIISEIFKNKKETFINLPLLASALFISMPMIVFQQAKDMKLDAWLFFISIIALYMLFEFYSNYKDKKIDDKNFLSKIWILKLFFVIWLLLGFAFTIKFTSLLLISAIFWILFFTRLWILGFLWYLSIYFAIFTTGWLWKMMNVVWMDDPEFKKNYSIMAVIIWIAFLITARLKNKKRFRRFLPRLWILFLWIIIAVSPWAINNINQADKFWVSAIISWKSERFEVDYNKIYSEKQLEKIENKTELSRWMSSSWTTKNEDFGRYFGYEKGINNYIKLPWNLTMQSNQGWEFTDIWFIFLALLPSILLFLPFRKQEYSIWVYLIILAEILIFIIPASREFITYLLSGFTLPFWYIFILLLFLLPLAFLIPTLQKQDLSKLFKINLVFTAFYTFLWWISAFWIVWYWIVMYFNFILLIIFWAYYLGSYDTKGEQNIIPHPSGAPFNTKESNEIQIKFFGTLVFFTIILVYIFMNVFPHTFNNLKKAGFIPYKTWNMTIAEASFKSHKEYLPVLFHLNISSEKREEFIKNNIAPYLLDFLNKNKIIVPTNIIQLENLLKQILNTKNIDNSIKIVTNNTLQNIYSWISNPTDYYKNNVWIYRIWTFLKYHISENNKRLYEDSLVTQFDKYIYDENPDTSVERIKKLWVKYFLVDLNAATIDQDPRHNLTKRYERLLKTFTSEKLELIDSDSICLKVALDNYKENKDIEEYTYLSGVNYDSYNKDWAKIWRFKKQVNCYEKIITLFKDNKVDSNNYSYLQIYKSHINKLKTVNEKIKFLHKYSWHWYKVLFKIK